MSSELHIIDLGDDRPSNERWAVGSVEPDPCGGEGRWVRLHWEPGWVEYHYQLAAIETTEDDEIIEVTGDDEVTR